MTTHPTTRLTAGAYLTCGDKILLMKRSLHKKLGPGMWAGMGGHMEPADITDPRALDMMQVCLREVQEETGITPDNIHNLKLRYITMRKSPDRPEVWINYAYFGTLASEIPPPTCDEGIFHWVNMQDILALPMTNVIKETLRHWLTAPNGEGLFLLTMPSTGDITLNVIMPPQH